jgi:hypothetical protein
MTSALSEVPRIYTSFAEFEREELLRLGLDSMPVPAPVPIIDKPIIEDLHPVLRPATTPTTPRPVTRGVTPASLRAEGILEIGGATGTSVLFVRTRAKLHLFHSTSLPDRALDDYAVALAVNWIEGHGLPSYEVARNLGVSESALRKALVSAGYERVTPAQHEALTHARAARRFGNRRGRLARVSAHASV